MERCQLPTADEQLNIIVTVSNLGIAASMFILAFTHSTALGGSILFTGNCGHGPCDNDNGHKAWHKALSAITLVEPSVMALAQATERNPPPGMVAMAASWSVVSILMQPSQTAVCGGGEVR